MAVTPSTNIKLLKCPLELDNKNQITFASKQAQFNYFNSLPNREIDYVSYQRKDNYIAFPEHIDNLLDYNYVMYQNENYNDKWFYAYITNMEYENDGTTNIYITTDVFQTWQFDFTWKQSFVEREMIAVANDSVRANQVPENFETGDPVMVQQFRVPELAPLNMIAYAGDEIKIEDVGTPTTWHSTGQSLNGIFSALAFIGAKDEELTEILLEFKQDTRQDNILSIFTVPILAAPICIDNNITGQDYYCLAADYTAPDYNFELTGIAETIDGYTPRNKKMLQYPYRYIGFCPSSGAPKTYKFEDFDDGFNPSFNIKSEINVNPQVCFIPKHHRGRPMDIADFGTMTGYPTISWSKDFFNSWIAQNHESLNLEYQKEYFEYKNNRTEAGFNLVGNMISAISSGEYSKAFSGGYSSGKEIGLNEANHEFNQKQLVAQVKQAKILPDSGTLGNSANTMLGYGASDTPFFVFNIKRQFAERIDKFWDLYGYQTNQIKIPNTNNRPNWNYVKTEGANIVGTFNQEDLQTLKSIFDNGVTLWHNTATFLDYSQNNR